MWNSYDWGNNIVNQGNNIVKFGWERISVNKLCHFLSCTVSLFRQYMKSLKWFWHITPFNYISMTSLCFYFNCMMFIQRNSSPGNLGGIWPQWSMLEKHDQDSRKCLMFISFECVIKHMQFCDKAHVILIIMGQRYRYLGITMTFRYFTRKFNEYSLCNDFKLKKLNILYCVCQCLSWLDIAKAFDYHLFYRIMIKGFAAGVCT